ncbi:hypothetical protein T492DRAFT_843456 [Pavlovales sp. CCMP2436]|nr:hypothetical protein T492DRAFT_843456 [Pavlovales sp. CCMP2436]
MNEGGGRESMPDGRCSGTCTGPGLHKGAYTGATSMAGHVSDQEALVAAEGEAGDLHAALIHVRVRAGGRRRVSEELVDVNGAVRSAAGQRRLAHARPVHYRPPRLLAPAHDHVAVDVGHALAQPGVVAADYPTRAELPASLFSFQNFKGGSPVANF